jgi:hypothetical protein
MTTSPVSARELVKPHAILPLLPAMMAGEPGWVMPVMVVKFSIFDFRFLILDWGRGAPGRARFAREVGGEGGGFCEEDAGFAEGAGAGDEDVAGGEGAVGASGGGIERDEGFNDAGGERVNGAQVEREARVNDAGEGAGVVVGDEPCGAWRGVGDAADFQGRGENACGANGGPARGGFGVGGDLGVGGGFEGEVERGAAGAGREAGVIGFEDFGFLIFDF